MPMQVKGISVCNKKATLCLLANNNSPTKLQSILRKEMSRALLQSLKSNAYGRAAFKVRAEMICFR